MVQKGPVRRDHTTNKKFGYNKDGVTLDFTLRTDVKIELVAFLEMLKQAVVDVQEELNKFK